MYHIRRGFGMFAVAVLLAGLLTSPVSARNVPTVGGVQQRFVGTVGQILGPADSPIQITLTLGTLSTDVRVTSRTVFAAKSAEASVEGLLQGDYAVVTAQRVKAEWIARRVVFDVQPIFPLHLFTGLVLRETPDGKRVTIRIAGTQRQVLMHIVKPVQYEMDGRSLLTPLALNRGDQVEVLALHVFDGWNAFSINVKTITLRNMGTRSR